ncbi:hypothetical protein Tco_1021486 [Tanacetum coccineum]
MANKTPIMTTVTKTATKEKTPKETDAAPRVNILDFCEEHYEDIFPGTQNLSVGTLLSRYHNPSERPKVRDRLRSSDENVFRWLGPNRANSRDHSHSRGHPHIWDYSLSRNCPQSRDHSHGIEESYGNTCSSCRIGALYRSHSHDSNRSHNMKRGREMNPRYLVCQREAPVREDTRSQSQKDTSLQMKKT